MEQLFKKYFWAVKLVGLSLAVAFSASALVTHFSSELIWEGAEDVPMPPTTQGRKVNMADAVSRAGGARNKSKVADEIVKASIFCPTCSPEPEAVASQGPVKPGEIKTSLPLVLLATMVADTPENSVASIYDTEKNSVASYSPSEGLTRGGVTLEEVRRGQVVLRNGRQLEYLDMGGKPPPPPAKKPKAKAKADNKKKRKNPRAIEGAEDAIDCASDTNCTVDRAFVEKLLANPAKLSKQARVVPAIRDGETRGFKFYGIRSGSLPKLLGLKNGDLMTSVNGIELKSLDDALGLYSKLRRASHLSVSLERKGKAITKEIDIK